MLVGSSLATVVLCLNGEQLVFFIWGLTGAVLQEKQNGQYVYLWVTTKNALFRNNLVIK